MAAFPLFLIAMDGSGGLGNISYVQLLTRAPSSRLLWRVAVSFFGRRCRAGHRWLFEDDHRLSLAALGGFEFAMVLKNAHQRVPSAAPVKLLVVGEALDQKGEILRGLLIAPRQRLAVSPGFSLTENAAFSGRVAQPQRFRQGGGGAGIVPQNLRQEAFDGDRHEVVPRQPRHSAKDVSAVEALPGDFDLEFLDEGGSDGAEDVRARVVAFAKEAAQGLFCKIGD